MIISAKSLSRLYKGAIHFEINRRYLSAYRFSRAQIEYMSSDGYEPYWLGRALISGPERIDLKTDATKISFEYKTSEPHPRSNTVDLYIDGALRDVYFIKDRLKGTVEFTLPEGAKRVSIYLPCESIFKIKNFTINGHYRAIPKCKRSMLIIGDSITQGAGPDISSEAYANILARELGVEVVAQGIGGYRYEPRDVMRVEGIDPDIVMVALGTNCYDVGALERDGYDYERAVNEFYDRLDSTYHDKKIVALTPIFRTAELDTARFLWCIDKIRSACQRHNITVIDGLKMMPNLPMCLADGVHPSTYGSHMLGMRLSAELKRIVSGEK